MRRWLLERALVFVAALAIRGVVAWIFFGCCDMWSDIDGVRFLYNGKTAIMPYLAGIQLLIWLGGNLAMHTKLPLTFCLKLFQITADSGVALLVYDTCRRRSGVALPGGALGAGLLYAFSPIAIFVSAFHAQWDPIFLFFVLLALYLKDLPSLGWRCLAGAAFVLGCVIKPVPAILAPCLLSFPSQAQSSVTYARRQLAVIAGMLGCFAAYYLVSDSVGYGPLKMLPGIIEYAKEGYPLLGLPVEALHKNRYLVLGGVAVVFAFYALRRIDAYGAALLVFTLLIGTCGLAPQYLVWPVPFAIIGRRYGFLAIYSAVCTAYMLLFYASPHATTMAYENVGTFATVKAAAWLTPKIGSDAVVPLIHELGAYPIPLTALGLLAFVIGRALIVKRPSTLVAPPPATKDYAARGAPWTYVALLALVFAGAAFEKRLGGVSPTDFEAILARKVARYDIEMAGRYYVIPATYADHPASAFNVVALGTAWTATWSVAAGALLVAAGRRRKPRSAVTTPALVETGSH